MLKIRQLLADQRGQDLIDYAMIAGFIAVVTGMFMPTVSKDISTVFSLIAGTI